MKNYVMLPLPEGVESMTRIMLKGDPYEGVIYQYGAVDIDERADSLKLFFEYEIFANPNGVDTECKAFRDILFEILVEVIDKACT